ncbi:hypothetical protein [Micromonospora sp. WMMD737]
MIATTLAAVTAALTSISRRVSVFRRRFVVLLTPPHLSLTVIPQ